MSLSVLIGPGLIIGRVGATMAMDIVVHIPIEKLAQVIVESGALVTTPRQCWLTFWKGTVSSEVPTVVMGLVLPSNSIAANS